MRELLEAALERNPNHRLSAADLLKHEALHPPPEEQPRCQSLDSALFERKRLLARKELQLPENITGNIIRLTYLALCRFYFVSKLDVGECLETNETQKAFWKETSKNPNQMRSDPELIKCYVKHPLTSTGEELSLNSAALEGLAHEKALAVIHGTSSQSIGCCPK